MVKILLSAVVIFIILCFTPVSNTLEDNIGSNYVDSPKDSTQVASPVSSEKPSSPRVRPSAWSKEEKENLKPRNDETKEQDKLLPDGESNLWNMKNLFHYVVSLLYAVNNSRDDTVDKLIDDLQIKMQNIISDDAVDKSENNTKDEMKNSDTLNKSLDDEEMQNLSNNKSFKNRQPTENAKDKDKYSIDKNTMDKAENKMKAQNPANTNTLNKPEDGGEMQNFENDNNLNKSSDNKKIQKSSNNDFANNKQLSENSKNKTQKSMNQNLPDESENGIKTDIQNDEGPETVNKSTIDGEIQSPANKNTLDDLSVNGKMQKRSNSNSPDSKQLTDNSKNNQQNSINKALSNKSAQGIKMQSLSNADIQLEPIPAISKLKEDMTTNSFKDYEDCTTDQAKLNDFTDDYVPDEKENEHADDSDSDNDSEEEYENDMNENQNEDEDINDINNAKNVNENDVEDAIANKNNYVDEGNLENGNQIPQASVIADEKADDLSSTLPKFIIGETPDKQNYSEIQTPRNPFDNNRNVIPNDYKSQTLTNKRNSPPEFQLSSSEFIDDYINKRQEKTPERGYKQPSNTGVLTPNGNDTMSKTILVQFPFFKNNFEEDKKNTNTTRTPSVEEIIKDQNMPFSQSQNTEDNGSSFSIFNEGRKNSISNKSFLPDLSPENLPSSVNKPVLPARDDRKVSEITPLKLFPFEQKPQFNNLQNTFTVPQEVNNVFIKPAAMDFQNTNSPIKTSHNDVPATNLDLPEIIVPFKMFPNKPIAVENEGYLNDQYENYNFQNEKLSNMNNKENQQVDLNNPTILQQDIFPNSLYMSNQGIPNTQEEAKYFPKYNPEMPVNIPNIEKPVQNTKMLPNDLIPDDLHSVPAFSEMYSQVSSPTKIKNITDKITTQDYSDASKPQNQINNDKMLKLESNNSAFQSIFSEQQIQLPQSDFKKPLLQSEMNNEALPYKSKMSSEIITAQDESKNTKFSQTQNDTNNSKELSDHSFSNTEKILIKPKEQVPYPVTSENMAAKLPIKSSKPFINKAQESESFNESGGQEQESSISESDSSNNTRTDEPSSQSQGTKDDEDVSKESKTVSDETDTYENEVEDDFVSENNYNEDSLNEGEDEGDYVDENDYADENDEDDYGDEDYEDDYADESDQDDYEDENDQNDYASRNNYDYDENKQKTVIAGEETQQNIVSPKLVNQTISDQHSHNITKPPKSQINNDDGIILETANSHSTTNDEESSSPVSELTNGGLSDDYLNNQSGINSKKVNASANPSDGTINDATMQIMQKPSSDTNDAAKLPETFKAQSEYASPNKGEKFNTILEYIYKYSNDTIFKGVRDEEN